MNQRAIWTATILGLGAAATCADPAPAIYNDELARCVTVLRAHVSDPGTRQIRHFVTAVDKKGAWYEFSIRSELYDAVDGPLVREVGSTCSAHRWQDLTRLQ